MSTELPHHAPWDAPPQPTFRAVVEEFSRLLAVLGSQLDHAMQDASRDSAALGQIFQRIAASNGNVKAIGTRISPEIVNSCTDIEDFMSEAVTELQFQDRLAQRAIHIRAGLEHLRSSLSEPRERSWEEWLALLRALELNQEMEHAKLIKSPSVGSAELF